MIFSSIQKRARLMYFPYFFGKASELLAIRSFAGKLGTPQAIFPVVEAVTASEAGLARAARVLKASGDQFYLVENPNLKDFRDAAALAAWKTQTAWMFADASLVRPVYKELPSTTSADLAAFAARNSGRAVGVILTGRLPVADVAGALSGSNALVFASTGADRVGLVGLLGASRVVELNDRFPAQRINADYSGEEWFSRDHLDFASGGHLGFADYAVLPPNPANSGGGAPGAVAIHLTYKASDGSLWVQHFVSDETDRSVGNAQSKMLEAIAHLANEVAASPTKFDSSPALVEYLRQHSSGSQSSLGKNKELEISHHLFVVARRLGI